MYLEISLKHCFLRETAYPLRLRYAEKTDRISLSKTLDLASQNMISKDIR